MNIGRNRLADLVSRIVADDPDTREDGAETVCDWAGSFDAVERRVVVRILSVIAVAETVGRVREAQLHAIAEVADPSVLTRDDVAPVYAIDRAGLGPSEREYVDGLAEDFG